MTQGDSEFDHEPREITSVVITNRLSSSERTTPQSESDIHIRSQNLVDAQIRSQNDTASGTNSGESTDLTTRELILVVIFAALGNGSTFIPRTYLGGFYLDFLTENNLNVIAGTAAISTLLVTQALSPYILSYLPRIKTFSLTKRCFILLTVNSCCYFVMSSVDFLVEADPGGFWLFVVVGVTRAFQGLCAGILTIIVQGEIVDLYLADRPYLMVVISSTMHLSALLGFQFGLELFMKGKWLYTGLFIPSLDLILFLLLPFIFNLEKKIREDRESRENSSGFGSAASGSRSGSSDASANPVIPPVKEMTRLQHAAFYVPDVTVFLGNLAFFLLIFSLPARLKEFTGMEMRTAGLFTTLIFVFSIVSGIISTLISNRKCPVLPIMLIGNVLFYAGGIMAFGSTTEFLTFPGAYKVGCVLVGLGNSPLVNLTVMSKFELFKKWGLSKEGLGEKSSSVFNLSLCSSQIVGTFMSGLSLSRASEVPTLVSAGIASIVSLIALVLCFLID